MKTIYNWRIWCVTDNQWKTVWDVNSPTSCPTNNAHQIDSTKTSIIDTISESYPLSSVGEKIAVHSSPKPNDPGKVSYIVWAGAGDNLTVNPHTLGDGEGLQFDFTPGTAMISRDLKFSPDFGKVWIHEPYLSYQNAGIGDYVTAYVVVEASQLQTMANKFMYIENNWVKPVPLDGSITPTHGFAATPRLMPRTFSHDGDWDYDGVNLLPNYTGTGNYKISDIDRYVHKFVNKIMISGNSPYFALTSDESIELPAGYSLRVEVHNVSNTTWNASVFVEIYREMTNKP